MRSRILLLSVVMLLVGYGLGRGTSRPTDAVGVTFLEPVIATVFDSEASFRCRRMKFLYVRHLGDGPARIDRKEYASSDDGNRVCVAGQLNGESIEMWFEILPGEK